MPELKPSKVKPGAKADKTVSGSALRSEQFHAAKKAPIRPVSVNFVPTPEVQRHEAVRTGKHVGVVLVGAVLALGAVWFAQGSMVSGAQSELDAANARTVQIQQEQQKVSGVDGFAQQIESARGQISATMTNEVMTSKVIRSLLNASGDSVDLTSFGVNLRSQQAVVPGAAATSECPSQDPFQSAEAGAGCVTLTGVAKSRNAVARWIESVEANTMFTTAFVATSSASEGNAVTFSATVGLAEEAFSRRYSDPKFLSPEGEGQ